MSGLRVAVLLLLIAVPITGFAQVSQVPPSDGSCTITNLTASQYFDGFNWQEDATLYFACHGTFYGSVHAGISLQTPGAYSTALTSTGTYGIVQQTWPYIKRTCTPGLPDIITGLRTATYCTSQVIPIPYSGVLRTHATVSNPTFRALAGVSWQIGAVYCSPYACYPNEASVSAQTPFQYLEDR